LARILQYIDCRGTFFLGTGLTSHACELSRIGKAATVAMAARLEFKTMATSKGKAEASKAIKAANAEALVGFDQSIVANAFRAMSEKRGIIDAATGDMQEAGVVLCTHAYFVAVSTRAEGGTPSDSAWTKSVRAMLPMLAKEGSRFVKVSEDKDGAPKYLLSGYGQNVNSVARGFVQYSDISPDDAEGEDGNVTFGALRTLVQNRRAEDRTDEEKALAESREALAEAIAALRKAAGSTDRGRITSVTREVQAIIDGLSDLDELAKLEAETAPEVEDAGNAAAAVVAAMAAADDDDTEVAAAAA